MSGDLEGSGSPWRLLSAAEEDCGRSNRRRKKLTSGAEAASKSKRLNGTSELVPSQNEFQISIFRKL